MRMKDKIRRAYDHAAPDVLDQVLQELPAQKAAPAPRTVTYTPRKNGWIKEFAATAAAFALLLSVIGGTVWYFDNYGGPNSGNTNPTAPSGDPGITQPSDTTPPNEPLRDIYVEDLDYLAEDILYPWYLRDIVYVEPEEKTLLWEVCTDDVYVLEKTMGSYSYEFHFDSWSGELLAIEVVNYTGTVQKYISEYVARAIAELEYGHFQSENGTQLYQASCQLIQTGSGGYYYVTLTNVKNLGSEDVEWIIAPYYVHARTGALLELGDEVEPGYTVGPDPTEDTQTPDSWIPRDTAIQLALDHANVETAYNAICRDTDDPYEYLVTFDDGQYYYEVTMNCFSGEILAFPTPVLLEEAERLPISPALAMDTALDYLGITQAHANAVSCTEKADHFLVTVMYENTQFVIQVDLYSFTVLSCEKYEAEDPTPPDGMIPEDIAIQMALDYAGLQEAGNITCSMIFVDEINIPAYLVTFEYAPYYYEVTIGAYSGELLAFPTPVLMDEVTTLPDGRISREMAIETALEYIGITQEQATNLTCTEENDYYYQITLEYELTYFVFEVDAYNPSKITCEKYEAEGATVLMARNYALNYIGTSMENVSFLRIEQDMGGEHDNPGFLIGIVTEGVEYQLSLDHYGAVLSCDKFDVGKNPDESRTDIIGWRAARDILLDSWGIRLDEVTFFRYAYVTSENYPDRYEIYLDENYDASGIIVAKNGESFYESETYNTAILTEDQVTEIVLLDVDQEIRESYAAGAYNECYIDIRICYAGGVSDHDIQLYYEWFLFADGVCVTYQVDAFTGEILLRDVNIDILLYDLLGELGTWYNMALTCQFEDPSKLELSAFFYNGFPDESTEATDEERAALQAAGVYWEEADLIRLPAEKMEEILIQYFNITLDEMDESCFEGLTYLESTDCYYMMHTDASCAEGFVINSTFVAENGNLIVNYTTTQTGIYTWDLGLEPWGTGYRILFNVPVVYD